MRLFIFLLCFFISFNLFASDIWGQKELDYAKKYNIFRGIDTGIYDEDSLSTVKRSVVFSVRTGLWFKDSITSELHNELMGNFEGMFDSYSVEVETLLDQVDVLIDENVDKSERLASLENENNFLKIGLGIVGLISVLAYFR